MITDIFGNAVKVGDTLAVATEGYNHQPQLRVGEVLDFYTGRSNDTKTPDQIIMFWHAGSGDGKHMVGTTSKINALLRRFAIVTKAGE